MKLLFSDNFIQNIKKILSITFSYNLTKLTLVPFDENALKQEFSKKKKVFSLNFNTLCSSNFKQKIKKFNALIFHKTWKTSLWAHFLFFFFFFFFLFKKSKKLIFLKKTSSRSITRVCVAITLYKKYEKWHFLHKKTSGWYPCCHLNVYANVTSCKKLENLYALTFDNTCKTSLWETSSLLFSFKTPKQDFCEKKKKVY